MKKNTRVSKVLNNIYFLSIFVVFGVTAIVTTGCGGGGDAAPAGGSGSGGSGGGGGGPAPSAFDTLIYGRVFNASTDLPLNDVQITVSGVAGQILTDDRGRFAFPLPGAGTYDLTATRSNYTYAQRRAQVAAHELASVRDMFLTPIDSASITIGPDGGRGQNSDGSIELVVPRGALDSTTDMRATWFNRGRDLPNSLPELSHFTYACELTPHGTTFRLPVMGRMRNTRGFAPGTPIPVGVYNSTTLEWEPESMGVVSADGQWVEFQVTHFSARDCNLGRTSPAGSDQPGDAQDIMQGTLFNNHLCGSVSAGSQVAVSDGHLSVDHLLPPYHSLGQPQTVALQYNSHLANPYPRLALSYDISQTLTERPQRMRFTVSIGGQRIERYFRPVEGSMFFNYRWDGLDGLGRELPDGSYRYVMTLANEYEAEFATTGIFGGPAFGGTGVMADEYVAFSCDFAGTVILRRQEVEQAPMGRGWGVVGLYSLREDGNRVTLTEGGGNVYTFTLDSGSVYTSSRGNFSRLTRTATGYYWDLPDLSRITFDTNGREVTLVDRNGNTNAFTYDADGRVTTAVDPLGNTTTFTYDARGRLSSITDPADRHTQFQIDDAGDLIRVTNPDGTMRHFTYDDQHRMVSQTDAGSQVTAYAYDAAGAVIRVDRPDGSSSYHIAQASSGAVNYLPADVGTETNPAPTVNSSYADGTGNQYTFTVNAFGTRTSITDPLGRTVTMARNINNLITELEQPSGKLTTYTYDDRGNLLTVSGPVESWLTPDSLTMTYGPDLNLPLTVTDDAVGQIENTYDDHGNLTRTQLMDGRTYTFAYNSRGQRTLITHPHGATTTFTYDANGNLATMADPGGGIWTFAYDAYGNLTRSTDADGREVTATYNTMNLLQQVANGEGDTVNITYAPAKGSVDLSGNGPAAVITGIADGMGNLTQFAYDEMYRIVSITDPMGHVTRFTYDSEGRLASRIEPTGAHVDFTYDDAGQLIQRNLSTGEINTYTYNGATGLLTSMTNSDCQLDLSYDWYELVSDVTTRFPSGLNATVGYTHRDYSYFESTTTLSDGTNSTTFATQYDGAHGSLPLSLGVTGGSGFGLYFDYDGAGRRSGLHTSGSWLEGTLEYDAADRLTQMTYEGTSVGTVSWEYSAGGNVTDLHHPDSDVAYAYDAAGRLIQADYSNPLYPDENYSYDQAGNRTGGFTYDVANRLTDDPTYHYDYDASGNLIRKTAGAAVTQYTYNAENRLVRVQIPSGTEIHYSYDPVGRLCERRVDPGADITRCVYDRNEVIAEFDGSNALSRRYVNGQKIDVIEGMITGGFLSGEDYYCAADPLGSVLGIADDGGTFVQGYFYHPFGLPFGVGGPVDNARLAAGMFYDPDAGLYYVRQRFYDPAIGRFIQRDPNLLKAAIAPYVYAGNNPVNARDPFGWETGSSAGGLWTLIHEYVVKPNTSALIGEALGRTGSLPPLLHSSLPDIPGVGDYIPTGNTTSLWEGNMGYQSSLVPLPEVGAYAQAGFSQYMQWRDVVRIYGADNPGEAGIQWYSSQWWNPARPYMESFLTMGGMFERRQARLGPVCGLRQGIRGFFAPQLSRLGW
jgi:RHS repeat-associated protein